MKKSLAIASGILIFSVAISAVLAQKGGTAHKPKKVIYESAEKADFRPSETKGVSMATLWGNPATGPHATFTKFDPGY